MKEQIIQIDEQTWRIEDAGVRFFLLTGTREALLVDSGMTVPSALSIARTLTDLPIQLLNTHADPDHIGSNGEFETVYMNPAECVNYPKMGKSLNAVTPVYDGDILDLGERILEVVALPGHTPGSIGLLDHSKRVFLTGDPIQDGKIFLFGPNRNLTAYYHSLRRAYALRDRYDEIWPSHGTFPVGAELIPQLMEGVERVVSGEAEPVQAELFGMPIFCYDIGAATFLLDK